MITPALTADIPALAALHKAAFEHPSERWTPEMLAESLCITGTITLKYQDKGFVLLRVMGEEAEILTLAVHPQYRRKGIASALLLAALQHAEHHAASIMLLEVAADNQAAQSLYQQHGFEVHGRRKAYYTRILSRVDAVLMGKQLNAAT